MPPRENQRQSIAALKRVMPRVEPEVPTEPTLLDLVCEGFREGWGGESDISALLEADGKD